MEITEQLKKRFFKKVNKDGPIMPGVDMPCWIWIGGKSRNRGVFSIDKHNQLRATHFSWTIYNGPLSKATEIYHKCNNSLCINPKHLYIDPITKFWQHVNKNGPILPHIGTSCWIWTGATLRGYGIFSRPKEKGKWGFIYTHRYSWILHNGPIPEGEGYHGTCVCHRCDTPLCVNPEHLFLGSIGDNVRDTFRKNKSGAKVTTSQVLEIRRLHSTGQYSCRKLSKMFNITPSATGDIVAYRTWKDLGPEPNSSQSLE